MPAMAAWTAADRTATFLYRIAFSDVLAETGILTEIDDGGIAIVISTASTTGAGAARWCLLPLRTSAYLCALLRNPIVRKRREPIESQRI